MDSSVKNKTARKSFNNAKKDNNKSQVFYAGPAFSEPPPPDKLPDPPIEWIKTDVHSTVIKSTDDKKQFPVKQSADDKKQRQSTGSRPRKTSNTSRMSEAKSRP